jgi:NitT/TauT family transport system ATP-binding protein
MSEYILECAKLTKKLNGLISPITAIKQLSFSVKRGEFFVIIGPSGCGKTTTLRVISGLEQPTQGQVLLNGIPISKPSPDCGLIPQEIDLLPWLTAQENVEFPLKLAGVKKSEREREAKAIINQVGLTNFAHLFPDELSVGMQQRIALTRALVVHPQIILMDEPFGALDAQTRFLMQQFLLNIWQETHQTFVLVTHQIEEALLLADRISVLTAHPGTVKKEIVVDLERPRDQFSSEFVSLQKQIFNLLREEVRFE